MPARRCWPPAVQMLCRHRPQLAPALARMRRTPPLRCLPQARRPPPLAKWPLVALKRQQPHRLTPAQSQSQQAPLPPACVRPSPRLCWMQVLALPLPPLLPLPWGQRAERVPRAHRWQPMPPQRGCYAGALPHVHCFQRRLWCLQAPRLQGLGYRCACQRWNT